MEGKVDIKKVLILPAGYTIERRKIRGEEGVFLLKGGIPVYCNYPRISGWSDEEIGERALEIVESVDGAAKLIRAT
jgi:hypothetical protein